MSALIRVVDLEVRYHIGVPEQERAQPQRLLLTIEIETDTSRPAASDDLRDTIDYFQLTRDLLRFGDGRTWKLLEKLASDLADFVLARHAPPVVVVEVKKFVIQEAAYVSVRQRKSRPTPAKVEANQPG